MADTLPFTDTSQDLAVRLADARARTDEIFSILTPEALYERPIPERHRLIFYLGHVEAFDWNLIARGTHGVEPFHERFDKLFAFGIDPVDGALPNEPPSAWPREEEVRDYNREVRRRIDDLLASSAAVLPMAIEHRLMHAETLAYLLHRLPYPLKRPLASAGETEPARASTDGRVRIPAGTATLGMSRESGRFGWDNEFESMRVPVPEFRIDLGKVTNGRYREFVEAGGYHEPRLWSDADWAWKEAAGLEHPTFWERRGGAWVWRGMFSDLPLREDCPVYVSHAEASAFARWAKGSLPTEAQFHRAAYGTPEGEEREFPWGDAAPAREHGQFDFHAWDPAPVGSHPAGRSAFGVWDLVGNGWEWTSTVFGPFPGFRAHPLYEGYSSNFFDGEHYVMKGGSPRTAACMLRRTFRNWFQPRYPFVYAALRLVEA